MKKAMINYIKNEKNDELYTPYYAIDPLIKYLYDYSKKLGRQIKIWECTDFGDSNITHHLNYYDFEVVSTHISNFNFLTDKPYFDFDVIITNPPYSLKDEFLKKCYEYNKPFALLLPITTLEGVKRNELFNKYGIELIVFDRRINYMNNKKSNWFNTSWFCWKLLPHQLIFERLKIDKGGK
jgi:hypothetical protein